MVLERLFVYGSLKCGGEAHHLLAGRPRDEDGDLSHVQLKIHEGYPMLCNGNSRVAGEVYWIANTHWPDLDAWENAPNTYKKICEVWTMVGRFGFTKPPEPGS